MTFADLSIPRSSDSAAKPSSQSFGRGGRPKSSNVTAGCWLLKISSAPPRSSAERTSYCRPSAHFICATISGSSSTMRILAFIWFEFQRQHDTKSSADTKLTLYLNATTMRLDNRFRLEHSDAETFFLGRLKGTKKRLL